MSSQESPSIHYLLLKARLEPQPFSSRVPVLGPLIVWVRTAWNSVSTRWYLEPLIRQQNEFNQAIVDDLRSLRGELHSLRHEMQSLTTTQLEMQRLLEEISDRLIANDRDVVALTHDLGKVTYTVIRLDEEIKRVNGTNPG